MTDPAADSASDAESTSDADAQSGRPADDRDASTGSEPTAATESMSEPQRDADDQNRSPTDADPDALFETERGSAESDARSGDVAGRGAGGSDVGDGTDDGLVSPDDGTITRLYWAGLATAVAFGAFALVRFYASVTTAIDVWVAADYEPLLQAGFNLVVLLAAGVAISLLLRRLGSASA